jgi:hypothetical protein
MQLLKGRRRTVLFVFSPQFGSATKTRKLKMTRARFALASFDAKMRRVRRPRKVFPAYERFFAFFALSRYPS